MNIIGFLIINWLLFKKGIQAERKRSPSIAMILSHVVILCYDIKPSLAVLMIILVVFQTFISKLLSSYNVTIKRWFNHSVSCVAVTF